MHLDKIKRGVKVLVFQQTPAYYDTKANKALADPTSIGYSCTVDSVGKNQHQEDIVWVRVDVDSQVMECYPEELVPWYGYTASDIRDAPSLPDWVNNVDKLQDILYQHEWKHEPWSIFQNMFTHVDEVRKHLEWLKRQ